jgi:hypothetical protein
VASSKKEEAKGLYRIGGQLWKVNPGKEGAMKVLLMALGIYEGPNYRGQPGMTMRGFRAMCKALNVPMIRMGRTWLVELFAFQQGMRAT